MRWFWFLTGVLCSGAAVAKDGDTVQPYVSLTMSRDSNVLRLDKGETDASSNGSSRSDTIRVVNAGVNVDWRYSRQQVLLSLSRSMTSFDQYKLLDYHGENLRADWNWRLGNHWSGNLGASRVVTQTQVSDLIAAFFGIQRTVNNLLTQQRAQGSAEWAFHPRWSARVAFFKTRSQNDQLVQRNVDSDETLLETQLRYRTPKGSEVSAQVQQRSVLYPNRTFNGFTDRKYNQTDFNLIGGWNLAGKVSSQAQVGYVTRRYQNLTARDFNGFAARASVNYTPTAKTGASLSVYREINGAELTNANFRLNTGVKATGYWQLTSKFALTANAVHESHNYTDDPGFVATTNANRKDKYTLWGAGVRYTPLEQVTLDLGVQAGARNSNVVNGGYSYNSLYASLRADF